MSSTHVETCVSRRRTVARLCTAPLYIIAYAYSPLHQSRATRMLGGRLRARVTRRCSFAIVRTWRNIEPRIAQKLQPNDCRRPGSLNFIRGRNCRFRLAVLQPCLFRSGKLKETQVEIVGAFEVLLSRYRLAVTRCRAIKKTSS